MSDWDLDEQLLMAWRDGDRAAAKQLIERHIDPVARFFRNKVGAEVDDLIQKTFLVFVENRDKIRSGKAVRAFLLSTANLVLCGHLRAKQRGDAKLDFSITRLFDLAPGPSSMVARHAEQRKLLDALRRIPIDDQIALELAYWEDLNAAEIAEIVGISHSAMRSRLSKARARLAEQLAADIATVPGSESVANLEEWAARLRKSH